MNENQLIGEPILIDRDAAAEMALMMYANEPCRICGKNISTAEVRTAVYAGYSFANLARSAHLKCWKKHIPRDDWEYPLESRFGR